jgi:Ca2+-binding EF-hand superfamily protein
MDVLKVVSTGAVVSVGKEASPPPRGKEASPPPRPAPPPTGSAPPRASPKEAAADGSDSGVAPNPNPNPYHNPDGGDGGVAPGKHRRRRQRQTPERLEHHDDERFLERMERRDEAEAEAVAGAASFIGGPKPAHVIANGPLPRLTEDQVVKAMDEYTVKLGAKALFERLDANRSGRVDAHELSEALQRMKMGVFEEAETLELIKAINRRHGSQRDSLALDVFAVAFSSKVANAKQGPLPSQASPQQASPTPLPANVIELVLEAIQRQVDQLGTRAVFDAMDADRSGRVSADQLVSALAKLKMAPLAMDAATAEELIRRINTRHGSKRKSLTFDIFAVAFAKGTVHGEGSRQTQQQQQQQLSPLPPSADKLKQQPPSPSVTAEQAMVEMQGIVARMGVKATFDMIDANRSGNVSAGELARTLRKLHVVIEEASAQELIFSINARHGSKRKSLTFDIFAVAFGANSPVRV